MLKQISLPKKNSDRCGVTLWHTESIPGGEVTVDIQFSKYVVLRMGFTHLYEYHNNSAIWAKMNISPNEKWWQMGSNPVEYKLHSMIWA